MSITVRDVSVIGDAWVKNRYNVSCMASHNDGKWFEITFTMDRSEPLPDNLDITIANNWLMPYIVERIEHESQS